MSRTRARTTEQVKKRSTILRGLHDVVAPASAFHGLYTNWRVFTWISEPARVDRSATNRRRDALSAARLARRCIVARSEPEVTHLCSLCCHLPSTIVLEKVCTIFTRAWNFRTFEIGKIRENFSLTKIFQDDDDSFFCRFSCYKSQKRGSKMWSSAPKSLICIVVMQRARGISFDTPETAFSRDVHFRQLFNGTLIRHTRETHARYLRERFTSYKPKSQGTRGDFSVASLH